MQTSGKLLQTDLSTSSNIFKRTGFIKKTGSDITSGFFILSSILPGGVGTFRLRFRQYFQYFWRHFSKNGYTCRTVIDRQSHCFPEIIVVLIKVGHVQSGV